MVKILIVDDEPAFTNTYVAFLKRIKDVETFGALNSKEAYALLNAQNPEVLLLDLNLNESVKGLDILKHALARNPKLYTLVTTGNMDSKVEDECLTAGAKSVIHKPASLQDLFEKVSQAVEAVRPSTGGGGL